MNWNFTEVFFRTKYKIFSAFSWYLSNKREFKKDKPYLTLFFLRIYSSFPNFLINLFLKQNAAFIAMKIFDYSIFFWTLLFYIWSWSILKIFNIKISEIKLMIRLLFFKIFIALSTYFPFIKRNSSHLLNYFIDFNLF